jgi:hypothetical protein
MDQRAVDRLGIGEREQPRPNLVGPLRRFRFAKERAGMGTVKTDRTPLNILEKVVWGTVKTDKTWFCRFCQ